MTTEWFTNDGSGISVHKEDENLAIVGDYIPDWVLIPAASPVRGGEKAKVAAYSMGPCPQCKREVRHLHLTEGLYVAQCKPGCGFLFYQFGKASVDTSSAYPHKVGEP